MAAVKLHGLTNLRRKETQLHYDNDDAEEDGWL